MPRIIDVFLPCLLIMYLAASLMTVESRADLPGDFGNYADRVLLNGRVLTVDARDSIAEAVAIRDGRIMAVGSNAEIGFLAGPETDRIDLSGLTVTPGLLDTHAHFSSGGLGRMVNIELSYPLVRSIGDIQGLVAARIVEQDQNSWVVGNGWDEGKLAEQRYVYAADLDTVAGNRPVWLMHTMGHYGTANSLALALAGITRETPDPPGGVIDRDENGNPTGVLKETAMNLVVRHIPAVDPALMREGMRSLARAFNSECMTGAKDPGIGFNLTYNLESAMQVWQDYQAVLAEGALTVRIFALWRSPDTVEEAQRLIRRIAPFTHPAERNGNDRLISGGIKLFADGSGGARTAWVWQDWNKDRTGLDEGNRGYPAIDAEVLQQLIRLYHDNGLHVGVHAIGDRAIDWTVASIALALIYNPQYGLRHSIIHANIPTELAMNTMKALQSNFDAAYPESQASFTWWIGDTYAGNFGEQRSRRLNPFHTFKEKGIKWGGGSDFEVTPFPARYGIWASMVRQPLLGVYGEDPFGQAEAVDVHTALRSFTMWAAHQMFLDDQTGSIEVGKYADLAVWDVDPYSAEPDAIKDMQCQMTLLEGEVVYRKEPGESG
jgi:predicted amidohydrolase YtcJ